VDKDYKRRVTYSRGLEMDEKALSWIKDSLHGSSKINVGARGVTSNRNK